MLLRILKSNQTYNLILFPLIGVLLWTVSLISPEAYDFFPGENKFGLFNPLYHLITQNLFLQVLISLAVVIVISFIIQKLGSQFAFIRVRTLLPSSVFILLVGGLKEMHSLHPVYFASLFFLFAIYRMFSGFEKKAINSNAFDTGLFLGIGSLFYFNLVFLYPAFVIGFRFINHDFNWRRMVLSFWGVLLPWIFAFSIYFLLDKSDDLFDIINQNLRTPNSTIQGDIYLKIYTAFWTVMLVISSFFIIRRIDEKKISTRKYFSSYFLILLFILGIYLIVPSASVEILVLSAIPSSYIISHFLISIRSKFSGELVFAVFVGLVIYMQFV